MDPRWIILSAIGLAILAASINEARRPAIGAVESRIFHAVNGLPGWLYWPLWVPMQLGNLVVGALAGLVTAWVLGDVYVAGAVVAATVLKIVTERLVRRKMADSLTVRQRPGTSQTNAIQRGDDVPSSGPSFPSGHVILVAAIVAVVLPALAIEWWWIAALLPPLVMIGRVYVGAHNPFDVTAGLGAGLLLGGALAMFVQ